MSAIAGLLCLDRQSIDADPAERMAAALGWRGGAEDGCYRSPEGRAVLAARPLAGTAQPLTNETHDVWLVLDGEIHNHRELRHTLTLLGHRFRSGSDVEVALHAYEQWDLDFPTHLHGAFALALWDDRRDRLVLARDRLGRKPLFVARHRGRLGFASGIGALMDELDLPRRLDPVALSHYLTVGTVPAPATLVAGISLLGGGEMLVCERGQTPRRRRWRWLTPDGSRAAAMRPLPAERHAGNLRTLLECAVADRLGSDGRAGVYLAPSAASGAIAAIATRLTGTPPATVAVCDDPHGAAAAEVQRLAQAAGVQPDLIRVSAGDVAAALPALVGRMVAPVASPAAVPTWFAAARSAPTRPGALLADGGAEELLLTRPAYAPYRCGPWRRLWQTLLPARRRPLEQNLPPGLRLFRDDVAPLLEVAVPAAVPLGPPLPDWLAGDRLGAVGVYDLALRVADGAAPAWDAAAQAHGIELRLPFLDESLADYALAVPGRVRGPARANRRLVRQVLRDLVPAASLARTEPPASLPLSQWLAGPLGEVVQACTARWPLLNREAVAALVQAHRGDPIHGDGLWALLVLAEWCAGLRLDQMAASDGLVELAYSRS